MILLDENIRRDQAVQLRGQGVPARLLVQELASPGIQDLDILPVLHQLKRPAFFTHDEDFFDKKLTHSKYCLVWLDVFDGEAAKFIRMFLKHPLFKTSVKRMGVVARVRSNGIHFWKHNCGVLQRSIWSK